MGSAVIIGGGLGGLFTGAILSREGVKVTVIEKNATIGGGLQSFTRSGVTFDTGMHIVGGLGPDGNIRKICRYLGIEGQMEIRDTGSECNESVYIAKDGIRYDLRKGRDGFIDSISAHFPAERENIARYTDAMLAMADSIDLYNIRPSRSLTPAIPPDGLMAASDFIASHTRNERLRGLLAYIAPRYGGLAGVTPAYVHCLINVLFIRGGSRFVGGSHRFADLLRGVIEKSGGKVTTSDAATRIETEDRHITAIATQKGERLTADWYISSIHPCALLSLMDEKALPKAFRTRIGEAGNSYSAFSVFIKLKEHTFRYIDHPEYYISSGGDAWSIGDGSPEWPKGFLFMTPPDDTQGEWAHRAQLTAPMPFADTAKWEGTTSGRRGAEYEDWKKEMTRRVLEKAETLHPGLSASIEAAWAASPLTIRDYYGAKDGTMYGFVKDCRNMAATQLPVATKIDNLLLTGQCVNLHGFCGVPLTAISTAEAILGRDAVTDKINGAARRQSNQC